VFPGDVKIDHILPRVADRINADIWRRQNIRRRQNSSLCARRAHISQAWSSLLLHRHRPTAVQTANDSILLLFFSELEHCVWLHDFIASGANI